MIDIIFSSVCPIIKDYLNFEGFSIETGHQNLGQLH